ncbi:uncharacterized protein N7503_010072 [Penicillium pulvis]|uniref:uncharacterized protein n=1 Tax=Penicillium pulvis TaxID=1562058 RepID=UPI0025499D91|nr:uncharacterized protein N7503_010072 [Penicillium pulvis]KAJ5784860.1 hypothetical protein N7503_010072 [Penicillium pulvis]
MGNKQTSVGVRDKGPAAWHKRNAERKDSWSEAIMTRLVTSLEENPPSLGFPKATLVAGVIPALQSHRLTGAEPTRLVEYGT